MARLCCAPLVTAGDIGRGGGCRGAEGGAGGAVGGGGADADGGGGAGDEGFLDPGGGGGFLPIGGGGPRIEAEDIGRSRFVRFRFAREGILVIGR